MRFPRPGIAPAHPTPEKSGAGVAPANPTPDFPGVAFVPATPAPEKSGTVCPTVPPAPDFSGVVRPTATPTPGKSGAVLAGTNATPDDSGFLLTLPPELDPGRVPGGDQSAAYPTFTVRPMDSFAHLFASHFTDPDRSLANSLGGFIDHAVRLAASLPTAGPLAPVLKAANTETQARSLRAQQVQQALGLGLGQQKLATTQTETAKTTALERIRINENNLKGDAVLEDPAERQRVYALLYPTGTLKYYTGARLETEITDRLGEYLTTTEAEADALGPVFVQRTQDALGPFRKIRETQVAKISNTGDKQDDRHLLVAELNEQCDYNANLLGAHFRTDPGRVANFWKQSFYARATPHAAPGQALNKAVQAHQHRQLFDLTKFATMTALSLTLRDGGPLALADKATAPLPATVLAVPAGPAPLAVRLADVPGTGPHLLIYNETGLVAHLDAQLS